MLHFWSDINIPSQICNFEVMFFLEVINDTSMLEIKQTVTVRIFHKLMHLKNNSNLTHLK